MQKDGSFGHTQPAADLFDRKSFRKTLQNRQLTAAEGRFTGQLTIQVGRIEQAEDQYRITPEPYSAQADGFIKAVRADFGRRMPAADRNFDDQFLGAQAGFEMILAGVIWDIEDAGHGLIVAEKIEYMFYFIEQVLCLSSEKWGEMVNFARSKDWQPGGLALLGV